MKKALKGFLLAVSLVALVAASFAGGQRLRAFAGIPDSRPSLSLAYNMPGGQAGPGSGRAEAGGDPSRLFDEVFRSVRENYVDPIGEKDQNRMSQGAVRTMLAALDDPRTRYYEPDQRKRFEQQLNGEFEGIGATLVVKKVKKKIREETFDQRRLVVAAPAPGGPAERAGLQAGDAIIEVDDQWVIAYDPRLEIDMSDFADRSQAERRRIWRQANERIKDGLSLSKALDRLQTNRKEPVKLLVERTGAAQPVKIVVKTESVRAPAVTHRPIGAGAAYLKVSLFNDEASREFGKVLSDERIKRLVLDLRNNPGGPTDGRNRMAIGSALSLFGLLAGPGEMGSVRKNAEKPAPLLAAGIKPAARRVVVLVNGGSANVAELLALALNAKLGAPMVGSATFGDGALLRYYASPEGGALTITSGMLLAPGGKPIGPKGIAPTHAVAQSSSTGSDPALDRAISLAVRS